MDIRNVEAFFVTEDRAGEVYFISFCPLAEIFSITPIHDLLSLRTLSDGLDLEAGPLLTSTQADKYLAMEGIDILCMWDKDEVSPKPKYIIESDPIVAIDAALSLYIENGGKAISMIDKTKHFINHLGDEYPRDEWDWGDENRNIFMDQATSKLVDVVTVGVTRAKELVSKLKGKGM